MLGAPTVRLGILPGDANEGDIMKLSLALAGAALLAGTLTACGGGDGSSGGSGGSASGGSGSDYCKDLKSASATFGSLSSGDTSKLDDAFATFHKLAGEAPGAIKDDWKTLDSAISTIQKALADAGLKFSDLDKIQAGQVPEGFDPTKLAGLATQFTKLNDANFTKASKAIETHAKSTCKVTLAP
jgi:hypothetical protein